MHVYFTQISSKNINLMEWNIHSVTCSEDSMFNMWRNIFIGIFLCKSMIIKRGDISCLNKFKFSTSARVSSQSCLPTQMNLVNSQKFRWKSAGFDNSVWICRIYSPSVMKRVMRMVCTAGKAEEFLQSVAIYTVASPFFQEVIVTVIRVQMPVFCHTLARSPRQPPQMAT